MDNYEALRQVLHKHPSGAPKSEFFDEILHILIVRPIRSGARAENQSGIDVPGKRIEQIDSLVGLHIQQRAAQGQAGFLGRKPFGNRPDFFCLKTRDFFYCFRREISNHLQ